MSADDGPMLQLDGIHKHFGDLHVLRGVDLEVGRGEVVCVIGPSGSGKSTLLRCINGLIPVDRGEVRVGTHAVHTLHTDAEMIALRKDVSIVFQQYNLFPHKTVLENVIEGPVGVQKRPRAEAVAEALALLGRVGLSDKKDSYPFELSGGQQQRVGIVRALALKPQLLLFDEPTSALDPELVGDVLRLIKELALEGWTMVIVTHELEFAREVAHEVAFVDGGVIVERGDPTQLLRHPQHERTKQFLHRLLFPF